MEKLAEILASHTPEELAKAVQDAQGIGGIRIIKDLWADRGTDMNAVPERNETKTGPAMHSSGAGVDKAIANYSNPAPQVGLVEAYEEFTRKNVEGWGNLYTSMKAMGDKFETSMAALLDHFKKAEEAEKEEKKEEKKEEMKGGDTPDEKKEWAKEEKEEAKDKSATTFDPATKSQRVAALWESLGELEAATAKAEGHDETKDIEGLEEARHHIEKAEKEIEKVEEHEKEEQSSMKANVYINLGWKSLAKATGLSAFDLKGYGNQKDEAVTGDSTSDNSKHDMKKAEEKAKYFASKAGYKLVKKDETAMPAATATPAAPPTAVDAAPVVDPAEIESLKAEQKVAIDSIQKSFNERIEFLNKRIEDVSGRKQIPMVPVILKSAGIKSDNIAASLTEKIETSIEAGELSEDNGAIARSLVGRYMAVGKGHIAADIVNQQLERAPLEVQNFFSHLEATV